MGYHISMMDSKFRIPASVKEQALAAMKRMNPSKKGSGYWQDKPQWAWVDQEIVNKAPTLEDAMTEWRYVPEMDDEGNIVDISFEGEKIGDEMEMFKTIAPFVEEGSYIEMQGEDGAFWRWVFKNGQVKEVTPRVEWDD